MDHDTNTGDRLHVDRVAVIGAGACGLAAARYLQAEKTFSTIQVFEQRPVAGGLWNYTSLDGKGVVDLPVPRVKPSDEPETPAQVVSPVYDLLETNIPHTLMNYVDEPFPGHEALFPKHTVVKEYLHHCAEAVATLLSLETQVLSVHKHEGAWAVEALHMPTGTKQTLLFDAVVVANGHYNDPFVPDIAGLAAFAQAHPGVVTHSKFFRRADAFRGKKVVVVGNSASGIDLSAQISAQCAAPVLVSEKEKDATQATGANATTESSPTIRYVPEIAEFLPGPRGIRLADGTVETGLDAVVFCTGYFYSFPFLHELAAPDGSHVPGLYNQILNADDTLAIIGLPQRVVPFPVAEAQSAWVARLFSGRCPRPQRLLRAANQNEKDKTAHDLAFPKDVEYINRLYAQSMAADRVAGLDNDGIGKIPPYWGAEKAWVRERFPAIKVAFRAKGEKRNQVERLEQLGFDFHEWQAEQSEALLANGEPNGVQLA